MKKTKPFSNAILFGTLLLAAPLYALANVQITEIMYDSPTADTGREWIEVTNTGQSFVDMKGYKLFEADTNHGLTTLVGTSTLAPGVSAVIVKDKVKFLADWPNFSSTLLKSTFSLSNTGETLILKDAKLAVVDTVSYTSSLGGNGDGESLHRISSTEATFAAGLPDLGVFNPSNPLTHSPPASNPSVSSPVDTAAGAKSKTIKTISTPKSSTSTYTRAEVPPRADPLPLSLPILGMVALVLLGVAGTLYARGTATPAAPEEFDI